MIQYERQEGQRLPHKDTSHMTPDKELLIGAHTSGAGGLYNALLEAQSIGATTCQLFTANQKRWQSPPLTDEVIDTFRGTLKDSGLSHIMSHDSYLINLGASNEEVLVKSRAALREELSRCKRLGITYLNFHPGASVGGTEEECFDRIIETLLGLRDLIDEHAPRLLIEATAGQGSTVGNRFEHLSRIIEGVKGKIPIGVCIDTCHIFAAGYDIRDRAGWDSVVHDFDKIVGLEHLYTLHVNDSMQPLGSRKDRHAPLGAGEIGIESFRVLMTHPKLKALPKYLETPGGPPLWTQEIRMLREFAEATK